MELIKSDFYGADGLTVRPAVPADLCDILKIYSRARDFMRETGNPTQWGKTNPPEAVVKADIERGESYVIEQGGNTVGVFAFIIGDEPTYRHIAGGWLNSEPYGTIHRIASAGTARGIFETCLEYGFKQIPNIRIDTHRDNKVMQHLIKKHGFTECGTIWVADGTPRIAYQKVII